MPATTPKRLAVRPAVDIGSDVAAELALQEMRNSAGEIDDVDAALKFAERVGVGLAVLARDGARDLVGVALQEFLELEERPDALHRRRRAPRCGGGFGGGDRGIQVVSARQRQPRDFLAGRRIEDG